MKSFYCSYRHFGYLSDYYIKQMTSHCTHIAFVDTDLNLQTTIYTINNVAYINSLRSQKVLITSTFDNKTFL